jgi:hypothetical protein
MCIFIPRMHFALPTRTLPRSTTRLLARLACAAAGVVLATALPGCSLLVGGEARTFDDGDASPGADATTADDAASDGAASMPDASSAQDRDASTSPPVDASSARDAGSLPPLDSGAAPIDAAAPPTDAGPPPTCPPPGAPPGTLCCGAVACIGEACQHCTECRSQGCAANEYCCVVLNGGGHVKGVTCSATPTCH